MADFIIPLHPSAILITSPYQVQESPDNSLFSFQIGATSQEEGEAPEMTCRSSSAGKVTKQRDDFKALAESAVGEIKSLNDTQASILRNKAKLEAERDRLLQELNRVNQAIDIADHIFLRFH